MEELDFVQPKKVVGEMISMSVIDDIKAEIEALPRLRYSTGERVYLDEVLEIIDKHIQCEEK